MTVIGIEGSDSKISFQNSEDKPCLSQSGYRAKVGTYLNRGQVLCIEKGAGKVTIECDRPAEGNSQINAPFTLTDEGTYPVRKLCPRDPGSLLQNDIDNTNPKIQIGGFDEGIPYVIAPRYTLLTSHSSQISFRWYAPEAQKTIVYQASLCKWDIEGQGEVVWTEILTNLHKKQLNLFSYPGSKRHKFFTYEFSYPISNLEWQKRGVNYSFIVTQAHLSLGLNTNFRQFQLSKAKIPEDWDSAFSYNTKKTKFIIKQPWVVTTLSSPKMNSKIDKDSDCTNLLNSSKTTLSSVIEEERINLSEYRPAVKKFRKGMWELRFGFLDPGGKTNSFNRVNQAGGKLWERILYYRKYNLYSEAISFLESFVRRHPSSFEGYYLLGILYAETGLDELARSSYKTAIHKLKTKQATTKRFRLKENANDADNPKFWEQFTQVKPEDESSDEKELICAAEKQLRKLYRKARNKTGWDEEDLKYFSIHKDLTKDCQ